MLEQQDLSTSPSFVGTALTRRMFDYLHSSTLHVLGCRLPSSVSSKTFDMQDRWRPRQFCKEIVTSPWASRFVNVLRRQVTALRHSTWRSVRLNRRRCR